LPIFLPIGLQRGKAIPQSGKGSLLELKRVIDPIAARLTNEGGAAAIQKLSRGENGSAAVVAELPQMIAELEA